MAKKKFKGIVVETVKSREVYDGADGRAVWNAIQVAKNTREQYTEPIHLDDSVEEIQYNLDHIVSIRKVYQLEDD